MKIKLEDLNTTQLDYAVALALGGTQFASDGITWGFYLDGKLRVLHRGWAPGVAFHPSTDYGETAKIVDEYKITVRPVTVVGRTETGADASFHRGWAAHVEPKFYWVTPQVTSIAPYRIAALRCFVASKLGLEIDVPEGLV